jgi:transcriptional regulator with XRE-family HTH domain
MLGQKIQQLRKENGLSQEELASKLTISRQAISKWELGESMPDTENIVQLSKLFGVSTDYLLINEYESDKDDSLVAEVSNEKESELLSDSANERGTLFLGIKQY